MDSSPTLPAVQPMILTPDEQAVIATIRAMYSTDRCAMLVLEVKPGKPGFPSGIMINEFKNARFVKRKVST